MNTVYLLLVIVVALIAIATGFRQGITGQLASLLGFAFGAVAARVLTPVFANNFQWAANMSQAPEFSDLTINLVCSCVIYFLVFCLFFLLSPFFNFVMRAIDIGALNRLTGAFFSLVKNLLWVSIVFNLALCFSQATGLLQYERSNDGNLVSAVMALTPSILGCYGAEDFAHFNQLKEAKLISHNIKGDYNVINIRQSWTALEGLTYDESTIKL